jgi:hypothetical protein
MHSHLKHILADDAWFFDLRKATWRLLGISGSGPLPSARRYHGYTHGYVGVPEAGGRGLWGNAHKTESVLVGVIIGGSVDSPSHVCTGERGL